MVAGDGVANELPLFKNRQANEVFAVWTVFRQRQDNYKTKEN